MTKASGWQPRGALFIRPLPNSMLTGKEAFRFGGRPRLPAELEWPGRHHRGYDAPTPDHFVAEFDLAKLPRAADGHNFPDFPSTGTIFFFLPLEGDTFYGLSEVNVLYSPKDVTGVPERDPPPGLPDLRKYNMGHVHEDGTTDGGTLFVRRLAEVLSFMSAPAANPLYLNMSEAEGAAVDASRRADHDNECAIEQLLGNARKFPTPPDIEFPEMVRMIEKHCSDIPADLHYYNTVFEPRFMDWEFIFDWAKEFVRLSYDLALDHLREMKGSGYQHFALNWSIHRRKKRQKKLLEHEYCKGRQPWFWTFEDPLSVDDCFDIQAKRWLSLAQFRTGYPNEGATSAFIKMLVSICNFYNELDGEEGDLETRIATLDYLVKGHDKHAGYTLCIARDAFEAATLNAGKRFAARFQALPQQTRWDSNVIREGGYAMDPQFSLGSMPTQMFGFGFDIQRSAAEHVDDVLLLQLGDCSGLPVKMGPNMILQL